MNPRIASAMAAVGFAALAAAAGSWWWQQHRAAPTDTPAAESEPTTPIAHGELQASTPAGRLPAIQYPIGRPAGLPPLPPADKAEAYVTQRLVDLLGRQTVLTLLNSSGFVNHFVATIDNLARESASARVWPVNPTPQRFLVDQADGRTLLSPKNAERYEPLVTAFESLDVHSTVALYRHLYPLFQQAYEELGFPGRYFNDRLIVVIDQLLETPEPAGPIALTLTAVKGPLPSTRPWVRYEYADPTLEARSAGQKILLRTGVANERRIKARLVEFRAVLVQASEAH